MRFHRILFSEWLKTKNTAIRKLTISIPVLYSAALLMYIFNYSIKGNAAVTIFDSFIQIWATIILPIGAGLIAGLMIEQEEQAGEFNGFLSTSFSRSMIYLGKLSMILIFSTLSIVLAATLLFAGLKYRNIHAASEYVIHLNTVIFIKGIILAQLTALPIFIIQLWIALAAGKGASIGAGCIGTLIAGILGGTMMGDKVWQFTPWTIPIRTADYLKFSIYTKVSNIKEIGVIGNNRITKGLLEYSHSQIYMGIIAAVIFTAALIFLSVIWFNRWEGRKVYD